MATTNDAAPLATPRLSFTEALGSGLPIRRRAWLDAAKAPEAQHPGVTEYTWIVIVAMIQPGISPFVSLLNGERVTLSRWDLLARDWEVLGQHLDDMN